MEGTCPWETAVKLSLSRSTTAGALIVLVLRLLCGAVWAFAGGRWRRWGASCAGQNIQRRNESLRARMPQVI